MIARGWLVGMIGTPVQKLAATREPRRSQRFLTSSKVSLDNLRGKLSTVDGLTGLKDQLALGWLLIAMSGGCQGCAASQVTLKDGLELMLRRVAPEIVDIVDTTDHASGTKPFYPQAGEAR
jgi:Fe-S cluster biogenesis protein NfuA